LQPVMRTVQPRSQKRLSLRLDCRGSFKRTEACVLASARLNIVFTGTSLQPA